VSRARLPDKESKDEKLKPMDTSKAWLAPLFGDEAVPAAEFKGNRNEAIWLPNEAIAKAWMEYVKTGATSDTTPPTAPFNLKATSKTDGREITWDAEADFQSGIQQFIVIRDGQELAKVPEKPIGKFGRPLFQSMTYHDTPSQPMPQMRYVDTSAKSGEKHAYAVITVNSVGLKSEPSCRHASFHAFHHEAVLAFGWFYLFSLAVSLAQTARMAASSPEPFGTASLLLLAEYQRVSDDVAVRLPGIWRCALVSVSRSQSQAYCSHLPRYSLVWCANHVISS